ncbi:MAG TPA: adenosylmethionine decarboxylase [Drouetiella sp.]
MQTSSEIKDTNLKQYSFAGRHLLASYEGCDEEVLCSASQCLDALKKAARASHVTVVGENVQHFPNGAVTAMLLLAESHASIHTYPEHKSCFVDFFTCGKGDISSFDEVLRECLKPTKVDLKVIDRGNQRHQ